jgi:hypothetical protein
VQKDTVNKREDRRWSACDTMQQSIATGRASMLDLKMLCSIE